MSCQEKWILQNKVSFYSDKKIAADLRNIGGNFLPSKICQNCEDCCGATPGFVAEVCDNNGIVSALNLGTHKSPGVMQLLRFLTQNACRLNFAFSALHTPGSRNSAADTLSRFNLQEILRCQPTSSLNPTGSADWFSSA